MSSLCAKTAFDVPIVRGQPISSIPAPSGDGKDLSIGSEASLGAHDPIAQSIRGMD